MRRGLGDGDALGIDDLKKEKRPRMGEERSQDAKEKHVGESRIVRRGENNVGLRDGRAHFRSESVARITEKPSFNASSVMRTTKS